jgi:hypothetical protein
LDPWGGVRDVEITKVVVEIELANSLAVFDVFNWTDTGARSEDARLDDLPADRLGVLASWRPGVLGVLVSSPLALVVLGSILNAVYLLLVSVATLRLSFRETDPRIKDGRGTPPPVDLGAAVVAVGIVSLANVL